MSITQQKTDFMARLINVYGLSANYANAAWFSVKDHARAGAELADEYCRRFNISKPAAGIKS